MTGYGDDWGSWKPHPSLASEWNRFSDLSSQGPHNFDVAKLCMRLTALPPQADGLDKEVDDMAETGQPAASLPLDEESFSQSSQPLTQFKNQGFPCLSQPTEDHDIDSFQMELHEILESHNIPLSEDVVRSLSELPQQAFPLLLQRLQEELTSEGLQTLCDLACEDIQGSLEQNTWLHPALICKFVLLPRVMSEDECSNEICQVVEEFARSCPKIVIGQIIQPLLVNEESVKVQSDLVKRVISALPDEHHLHLIKFVLHQCVAPLAVPQINVLLAVLGAANADLNAVLKRLMNLLEKSAASLADNEHFSNLLLIIIRKLPKDSPQPVKDILASIVRQNKSFNKQTLLNALKEST